MKTTFMLFHIAVLILALSCLVMTTCPEQAFGATSGSYSIAFNAGGGQGTMPTATVSYGTSTALPANAFTRPGYRFSGWKTSNLIPYAAKPSQWSSSCTTKSYNDSTGEYTGTWSRGTSGGSELFIWTPTTMSIQPNTAYSFSIEVRTTTPSAYTSSELFILPASGATNSADGSNGKYLAGTSLSTSYTTMTGSYAFSASVLKQGTWGLRIDNNINGNNITSTLITKNPVMTCILSDRQSVLNLAPDDTKTVTLTAQWEPLSYSVSFDADGGLGSMPAASYNYGTPGSARKFVHADWL